MAADDTLADERKATVKECEFAAKVLRDITARLRPAGDMRTLANIANTLDYAAAALRKPPVDRDKLENGLHEIARSYGAMDMTERVMALLEGEGLL